MLITFANTLPSLSLLASLVKKNHLFFITSAGVGRTGTFIGIDAMLESAKEKKTVFIQNYVQVMRRNRPHMVQKDVSKCDVALFEKLI